MRRIHSIYFNWIAPEVDKTADETGARQTEGTTFSVILAICAGMHRWPVNSPHKVQWRRALMSSLICTRINGGVKNREAGDLRCHRAHYGVTAMKHLWISKEPRSFTNDILIFKAPKCNNPTLNWILNLDSICHMPPSKYPMYKRLVTNDIQIHEIQFTLIY